MNRRTFVTTTIGAALVTCLAGCLGGDGSGDDSNTSDGGAGDTDNNSRDAPDSTENGSSGDTPDDSGDNDSDDAPDGSDGPDGGQSAETTAEFTWQPSEPTVQAPVELNALGSTGDIVEYHWDFDGDGIVDKNTTSAITTHSFTETGDKPVTLKLETIDGETATTTEEIPVGGVAAVLFATTTTAIAGRETPFTGAESAGDIAEYRWDFDSDGTFEEVTEQPETTHVFEEAGTATVTLEIKGENGQTDRDSTEISLSETAPFVDAALEWDPFEPVAGEDVTFDAAGSLGDIIAYRWDFDNDGEFETVTEGPTVTHTFEEGGTFPAVTLEIEGSNGETDTRNVEVPVLEEQPDPPAPEADFDWTPSGVLEDEEVTFQAFSATGDIEEYRWDFDGDGTFEEVSGGATATHTFTNITDEVEKPVTLEIEDSQGRTDAVTYEVQIEERPGPQAALDATPSDPDPGDETTLDASASTGDIVVYRWDFDGDGNFDQTTEEPTTTHVFEETGTVTVTLEVEGPSGETDTASLDVPVGETAELDAAFEWEPPEPAVGDEVIFDASESTGNIFEYRWDFDGDGTVEMATDIPETTHVFEESGTATVTLELQSEGGKTAQTTKEVPVSG